MTKVRNRRRGGKMRIRAKRVMRKVNEEKGVILPMVVILMLALTITGLAFLSAAVLEHDLAMREVHKNKAFYLAEAGLERTLGNLDGDFENGNRDWTVGEINGVRVGGADADGWRVLQYGDPPYESDLGDGSYLVKLKYVDDDEVWIRSRGTVEGIPRTVQIYAKIVNVSPWNNAIFAGTGMTAQAVIEGNARIHGSVLVLGDNMGSEDLALDMSGGGGMRNNYEVGLAGGMPLELAAKVAECPTTSFNGETVESLDAMLRVKQGKVGLSGTAVVGEEDWMGNSFKETVDGVYVTHGYGGNQGELNVYSDNGTGTPYDLGDAFEFPSLLGLSPYINPVTGLPYATHLEYLQDNSLHIPAGSIPGNQLSGDLAHFDASNGYGSITWDWDDVEEKGILTVDGIVYMEADSLVLGQKPKKETIIYSGRGTLVVAHTASDDIVGDIVVHADLLPDGTYDTGGGFPTVNVIGLVAGDMYLAEPGDSHLYMTGAFYAENQIVSARQNEIGGTFFSNYFDMGSQVPHIYQVPELAENLPPGMPAPDPIWRIITRQWSELPS